MDNATGVSIAFIVMFFLWLFWEDVIKRLKRFRKVKKE